MIFFSAPLLVPESSRRRKKETCSLLLEGDKFVEEGRGDWLSCDGQRLSVSHMDHLEVYKKKP